MVLEIHRLGAGHWPRYFLVDHSPEGRRFWNGTRWVSEVREARLYAFLPEVCREFERLKAEEHPENIVQEFEAKVTVKLHAPEAMSEQELARFLDRFADLFLPMEGPTRDSLIEAEIHWHELHRLVEDSFLNNPKKNSAD